MPIRLIYALLLALTTKSASSAADIDFAHDVVPVLRKHCIQCHGGREAKGSFSLNTRELLISSGHVVLGKSAESHLLQLIASDNPDEQMPPRDRPRVSADELRLLQQWIDAKIPWDDGFTFAATTFEPPLKPRRPELPAARDGRSHPVDRILDDYLAQRNIPRPAPIDDPTFLRRAHLDLVGLLPTPGELSAFLSDHSPNRRERAIDRLLASDIAYADHWLTFFNDLLRNDYSGTGFITGGRRQVSTWLYDALLTNKPFDQFARELIAPPTPESQGYIDGIRWRGEVSAGQTVEIQFAQSISQSFLGINMKCASCHDSFIDRWKLDEAYALAAIYSERPLEIHRCDKPAGRQAKAGWLFPEIGQVDPAAPRNERLKQLAALMTHPENGRFTRTIANRLWYKLMGRGIVHPLDAMQSRPWNEDLLDYLAVEFRDSRYNLKALLKLIATSEAYQSRSDFHPTESVGSAGEEYRYAGPIARRMTAEQFLDGVWQITGAAPTTMDAAVIRAVIDSAAVDSQLLTARWIWGGSAADGKIPPAGESIVLRTSVTLAEEIQRSAAVVTCDNSMTLFVNGREIQKSEDFQKPVTAVLSGVLKKGDNEIVVMAQNGGSDPNPAGLFFQAGIVLKDGSTVTVSSDEKWQWNANLPKPREGRLGKITGDWMPVSVVQPAEPWNEVTSTVVKRLLAQISSSDAPMIRASLVKSDFLMRSLGRPLREQIVSMRPTDLTTLEAVDLSNGPTLAAALTTGAQNLKSVAAENPENLVRRVYESAFSRAPAPEELAEILQVLGDGRDQAAIEDFLWSVFMTPEYMVVR